MKNYKADIMFADGSIMRILSESVKNQQEFQEDIIKEFGNHPIEKLEIKELEEGNINDIAEANRPAWFN